MRYKTLGASGCAVSSLALGTMTFGSETGEADSHAQLDRFVEAGGNFIDTADVYSRTESEAIIGRWLKRQGARVSDDVVISTKARHAPGGRARRHLHVSISKEISRSQNCRGPAFWRPPPSRRQGHLGHDRPYLLFAAPLGSPEFGRQRSDLHGGAAAHRASLVVMVG